LSTLSLAHLHKRFGRNVALMDASLELAEGEILAILGENGAGKTTLMNILYGLLSPDRGEMKLDGKPYTPTSPSQARHLGIGMVHQHFMLVPTLTVGQNILLGEGAWSRFSQKKSFAPILEHMKGIGFDLPLEARVDTLSVGELQRVEIFKALWKGARLLILDEPTAVLTPQETDELCALLRNLSHQGVSILFISHKLEEIEKLCDRVTILRRGQTVACLPVKDTTRAGLSRMMLGRDLTPLPPSPAGRGGTHHPPLLVREGGRGVRLSIRCHGATSSRLQGNWILDAPEGQITAVAGVEGNGQKELAEAILGISTPPHVEIRYQEEALPRGVSQRIEAGIGFISEDRQRTGLVPGFTVQENLALKDISRAPWSRNGWLAGRSARLRATALIDRYKIHPPDPDHPITALSGGNQQKVVVAREISRVHRVLVATNPTRGLDVGACEAVHAGLIEDAQKGAVVLLISTELDEVLDLADNLYVLFQGHATAIPRDHWTKETIGLAMLGVRPEGAQS
jgi:general nucleoside transport system ATP-binding protein